MNYVFRCALLLTMVFLVPASIYADYIVGTDTTQNGGVFVVNPANTLTVAGGANNPLLTLTGGATTSGITGVKVADQGFSQGQILVTGGSVLSNSGDVYIASGIDDSIAKVTVSGPNSQWLDSGNFVAGTAGNMTLRIENGGKLTSVGGIVGSNISRFSSSVTVTGANSQWLNPGNFGITRYTTMSIEDGGYVSNQFGTINGKMTVTGEDSLWYNTRDPKVSSGGILTIEDGGTVQTLRKLEVVGAGTVIADDATIIGDVLNTGLITLGQPTGKLTIDGDLETPGRIEFDLASATDYDQLSVSGFIAPSGVFKFSLINGYQPTVGTTFKVLDFSTFFTNQFYTLDLSSALLGPGLSWNIDAFKLNGTIRVVVPEASSLCLVGAAMFVGLFTWRKRTRTNRAH